MQDLELMRHITIGQYIPTRSVIHRLDPRTKIVGLGLLMIAVVANRSVTGLLVALAFVLILVRFARVPLGFASGGLRPALPVLFFIALLQLLFGWGTRAGAACPSLWAFGIINITGCSLLSVFAMLLRLVALIMLTGMLTMTSTISELTHGLEKLMRPLQKVGFPAHEVAMVFTIALRFVPTLAEELEKLLKAQIARGANINLGSNPVQRVRYFLPVLVPLFLTTLRRGEMLIEAMEARGYSGSHGRSHYVRLRMTAADANALVVVAVFVIGLFIIPFVTIDAKFLILLNRWF